MGYIVCDELLSWDIDYKWQLEAAEMLIKSKHVNLNHMEFNQ